jgi:hypothetical protein
MNKKEENINKHKLDIVLKFHRTKKGVLTRMYNSMKRRHPIEFSLKEFHNRFLTDKKYIRLFDEWVKHKYNIEYKPSIDRIDYRKPYTVRNTHMLTWKENSFKQKHTDMKFGMTPRVIQLKDNKIIRIFRSQGHCAKQLGIAQSSLSYVLNGTRNHVGGYQFIYEK